MHSDVCVIMVTMLLHYSTHVALRVLELEIVSWAWVLSTKRL